MNSRYSAGVQKPKNPLYTGTVVPGPIEEGHLSGGRKLLDVALKIPLTALGLVRFVQGHDSCSTRIQMFHKSLDRPTFPSRVSAPIEGDHLLPARLDPLLSLHQLRL